MDNDILFNILKGVVIVATALITGFVVPYIKNKIEAIQNETLKDLIKTAVENAEQTITDPYAGNKKKQKVYSYLINILEDKGFKIDPEQLDILIEAAVYTMNNTKKDEVKV